MQISQMFKRKPCVFSIECFPPKQTANFGKMKDTLRTMRTLNPDFISVTYGAGGSTGGVSTVEVAEFLKNDLNVEPLAHMICMGSDKAKAAQLLDLPYRRFDMSEYGQSHSDQKLLGAPPGYVGYEAGGQLTNAVKKNPFCILLFDEIEKAHPSIFDKFLQILEDGRLTDGQGHTVYFSETIIIFTSNLGMYVKDALGQRHQNVSYDMPYDEVTRRLREAIGDYFKLELGRPEILNRIGENIVIFDFIRQEAGQAILRAQVDKLIRRLKEQKNLTLVIPDESYQHLSDAALADLTNGGRGIGNQVEALLINPLSRYLFDSGIIENATVTVDAFETTAQPPALRCTTTKEENT